MSHAKVRLGRSVEIKNLNIQKLMKRAEAVASSLIVPDGVEFARFEHEGKGYALSVRLLIDVESMSSRVPDIVIRRADLLYPGKGNRSGRR